MKEILWVVFMLFFPTLPRDLYGPTHIQHLVEMMYTADSETERWWAQNCCLKMYMSNFLYIMGFKHGFFTVPIDFARY